MTSARIMRRTPRGIAICIGIGLLAGLLSGLFGVGGGTVVVPLLVLLLGFDQRLAAGTSLAAIVPTATVGVISYGLNDAVAWIPALLIAAGAVGGAQIGTWLLPKVSQTALRWIFVGFLVAVIVSLFLVIPSRDAQLVLTWGSGVALVLLGVMTGTVSGLIGVGGGIIVVPVLMMLFGTSDLVAKGTSLLMMIPAGADGGQGDPGAPLSLNDDGGACWAPHPPRCRPRASCYTAETSRQSRRHRAVPYSDTCRLTDMGREFRNGHCQCPALAGIPH
ncbi:MAG: permease [Microbacterium sp.]|nr:permease [Microbacterium sp.]